MLLQTSFQQGGIGRPLFAHLVMRNDLVLRFLQLHQLAKLVGLGHLLVTDNIQTVPPQGYLEMLGLMCHAALVITDSGGIQEETTALGVPCITMRDCTERPITVDQGTNSIVGRDVSLALSMVEQILTGGGKQGRLPELWDGHAAQRIADHLAVWLASEPVTSEA